MASTFVRHLGGLSLLGSIGFLVAGCGSSMTAPGGSGGSKPPGGGNSIKEYLYVGGYPYLDIFQVQTSSGVPSSVQNINVAGAASMAATRPTKFLYTSTWNAGSILGINAFSIASNGTLTALKGSPFPLPVSGTLAAVADIALSPDNGALYVNEAYPEVITGFQADPTTGELTRLSTRVSLSLNSGAGQVIVDPTGQNLYAAWWSTGVSDANGNQFAGLVAFSIDPTTRELAPLGGSPYSLPSGSTPLGMAIDPSSRFVYVVLSQSGQIQGFSRNANTGNLTPFPGSPLATPSANTSYVAMHPTGAFLFALGYREITTYSIDNVTGMLKEASIWTEPGTGSSCSPTPPFVIDPTGTEIYTGTGTFAVCVYQIDQSTGALNLLTPGGFAAPNGDGESAAWLAVVPAA